MTDGEEAADLLDRITPPDAGAGLTRYDLMGFIMEETDNGEWVCHEDAAAAIDAAQANALSWEGEASRLNHALIATQERLGECNAGYETLVKELAAEKAREPALERIAKALERIAEALAPADQNKMAAGDYFLYRLEVLLNDISNRWGK